MIHRAILSRGEDTLEVLVDENIFKEAISALAEISKTKWYNLPLLHLAIQSLLAIRLEANLNPSRKWVTKNYYTLRLGELESAIMEDHPNFTLRIFLENLYEALAWGSEYLRKLLKDPAKLKNFNPQEVLRGQIYRVLLHETGHFFDILSFLQSAEHIRRASQKVPGIRNFSDRFAQETYSTLMVLLSNKVVLKVATPEIRAEAFAKENLEYAMQKWPKMVEVCEISGKEEE